jgi:PAP2 superfamily
VHLFMLASCSVLLAAAIAGYWITSGSGWQTLTAAVGRVARVSVARILRHDRGEYEKRNAALALPWTLILVALIPPLAVLSAQLRFPLRDTLFLRLDQAIGFPGVVHWTTTHWPAQSFSDSSYSLVYVLLPLAMLVPPIGGNRKAAEQFVLANTIAVLISFPVFTLYPAIGPWAGYHFPGNETQKACQAAILALHGGDRHAAVMGIVCFPSFHVIWAVLSGWSLWSIKPLRILGAVLALLVVVTTGWHYVCDVLPGFLVVAISLACARVVMT